MGVNKSAARNAAIEWWRDNMHVNAVCDGRGCGRSLPKGEGYLCKSLTFGAVDLVCESCFDRFPYEPYGSEQRKEFMSGQPGLYRQDPCQDREMLPTLCRPEILRAYRQAITDGMESPVVVLFDCKDTLGGHLARHFIQAAVIDRELAAKPLPTQPAPVCMPQSYSAVSRLLHAAL